MDITQQTPPPAKGLNWLQVEELLNNSRKVTSSHLSWLQPTYLYEYHADFVITFRFFHVSQNDILIRRIACWDLLLPSRSSTRGFWSIWSIHLNMGWLMINHNIINGRIYMFYTWWSLSPLLSWVSSCEKNVSIIVIGSTLTKLSSVWESGFLILLIASLV